MKTASIRILIVAVILGLAWGGYRLFKQLPQRQQQVAIAKVRRGDVVIRSFSRGELRAVRSATLTAPNLFSTVQVTRLAPVGSLAKDKDLIVEFDDSDRKAQLEETLLEVDQIDEQIKKAQADLAIRNNQDQVDLLKTKYAVRRAELEVKRNELLSAIDAKKNLLTLEEQRRRLKQLEELGTAHPAYPIVGNYLGQLAAAVALVGSPQRIIFGGGVLTSAALLPHIRQTARRLLNGYLEPLNDDGAIERYIGTPGLGNRAGLAGAFLLAAQAYLQ